MSPFAEELQGSWHIEPTANVKPFVAVRQAQERLIVAPVLVRLQAVYRQTEAVEEQLLGLLSQLRMWEEEAQGYGPANLTSRSSISRPRGA